MRQTQEYHVIDIALKTFWCSLLLPTVARNEDSTVVFWNALRDGPLEKLWGERNFRAAEIFFRYQIPCMNFFRINWRARIFSCNFPCANIFFVLRPPLARDNREANKIRLQKAPVKIGRVSGRFAAKHFLFHCIKGSNKSRVTSKT